MLFISRLTIFGVLLLTLAGCRRTESNELNQDKIFCLYEIEYKAAENETYVRAQFSSRKENGSKLELSEPSEIKFGNDVLIFDEQFRYYQRVYTGRRDTGTFVWRDTDNTMYYNFADMSNLNIDYPIGFGNIAQNADYIFTWRGAALSNNQTANLVLTATNSTENITVSESDENAQSLTIKQSAMQNLPLGEYRTLLSISHEKNADIATDAGGKVRTKYSAAPQNIVLVQ